MNILLTKKSIAKIALLILLLLSAVSDMTVLVNATAMKDPTVYITGSGSVELNWKSGKSQTCSWDVYANLGGLDAVTIIPSHGWHIGTVLIDGIPQGILDEDGFSLINVQAKSMISAVFQENGGVDDVETGFNVGAYPDPDVTLIFANVAFEGWAYAYPIGLQPPDAKCESWVIHTDATFIGGVAVILACNLADLPDDCNPYSLKLLRTEVELARADINLDGMVNGTDVSIVANANPSELGSPNWDPILDLNDDGLIDDEDVNIVNNYIGESVWEDITLRVVVDNDLVYVYGLTDHFTIFGVH